MAQSIGVMVTLLQDAKVDALALARDLKHGAVMPGWN
jgi:hypothetical protein